LSHKELSEDLFPQTLRALTEVSRRLSCIAKIGVGDTGLGLAEIDATRRHFMFIRRVRTADNDAIHRMVKHSFRILACRHKQPLRKCVDRILREMIGWRKIDRLKHDELLDLPATDGGNAMDRLPLKRRQIFLRLEGGQSQKCGQRGGASWEQMHAPLLIERRWLIKHE
jgi:hypothetical protein